MATQSQTSLLLLALCLMMVTAASATKYYVGGEGGWNFNTPGLGTLNSGDTVVFIYAPQDHNVYQVDQNGYNNCDTSSSIGYYDSGNDQITLSSTSYFICGVPDHCENNGMKIAVTVQ